MNYDDLKLQIVDINNQLFSGLKDFKAKYNANVNQLLKRIASYDRENTEKLKELEKLYEEEVLTYNKTMEDFASQIQKIENELALGLNVFQKQYDLEEERQKIINNKQQDMLPVRQLNRRELHEINFKIEKVKKELVTELKEKEEVYLEEERNYKAKITEIDKREKLEKTRINSIRKDEYDEIQQKLANENNNSEIKKLKKKEKEIKKVRIIEEKNNMLGFVDERKEVELKFTEIKLQYNNAVLLLHIENNIKLLDLEFEKLVSNNKADIESYEYDYKMEKSLNDFNKTIRKNKNAMVVGFNEKKLNIIQEKNQFSLKYKNEENTTITNFLNNEMMIDLENIEFSNNKVVEFKGEIYEEVDTTITNKLKEVLDMYKQIIIAIYNDYFTTFFDYEKKVFSLFQTVKYNISKFEQIDVTDYIEKMNEWCLNYQNYQNESIEKLLENINKAFVNVYSQIDAIEQTLKQYRIDTCEKRIAQYNSLKEIVDTFVGVGSKQITEKIATTVTQIHDEEEEKTQELASLVSTTDANDRDIDDEHLQNDQVIEKNKTEFLINNKEKMDCLLLENEKNKIELKNKIDQLKVDFELKLKNNTEEICERYVLEKDRRIKEYKKALELL